MNERPQKIKDLLYYFQSKEILLYLFLINCRLIRDETVAKHMSLANVSFQDGNFVLRYNEEAFDRMSREEIYFVLLHEAFHVFKLHLTIRDRFRGRDDWQILNLAMDGIINEEIFDIASKNKEEEHKLLVPKISDTFKAFKMPEKFKKKFPKEKWTTEILYDWLYEEVQKQIPNPKSLLKEGGFCKIDKPGDPNDGEYGKIEKIDQNGNHHVETRTREQMIREILGLDKSGSQQGNQQGQDQGQGKDKQQGQNQNQSQGNQPGQQNQGDQGQPLPGQGNQPGQNQGKQNPGTGSGVYTKDELIPVVPGGTSCNGMKLLPGQGGRGDIEVVMPDIGSFERSDENGEDGDDQIDDFKSESMLKGMVEEAKQIRKLDQKSYSPSGAGNFLFDRIDELYSKNLINWKSKLRRDVDLFIVREKAAEKKYRKSYFTYLRNPKSMYGLLCKHRLKEKNHFAPYVLLAIDTSGSIFCSENELKLFFTEIENLSKWLQTMHGRVLTVQWDTRIAERLCPYNTGDWKKIKHGKKQIRGGGGTDPTVVFRYLNKIFKREDGASVYSVNENGVEWVAPWEKFPLLVFLTDGCFSRMGKKDLGIYRNAEKKILYLTEDPSAIYPKDNYIIYNRESLVG